jgi:redox-sensitive bicupin YhaK (pirin superfamily)
MQPQVLKPREVKLSTRTEISVRRLLPHAALRRIGAWVFLDHFGPTPQQDGMRVQRHPHTGLQTVTWLFDGLVEHRDSVGSQQTIRPGQLNLMTAGRGVAHSELSLSGAGSSLHAVQLWLALPAEQADRAPSFQHVEDARRIQLDSASIDVFIGEYAGIRNEAEVFSPIVGAEVRLTSRTWLPLRKDWQFGLLAVEGSARVSAGAEPVDIDTNELAYLGEGNRGVWVEATGGQAARLVLLGGEPFTEELIMWWNFLARTPEELTAMRDQWNAQSDPSSPHGLDALAAYPMFADELGGWIPAPELPNVTLRPRG